MSQIHASAHVGKDVVIGEGTTVGPGAVIEDGVRLGKNNTIWANAFIARGTTMGDGNHVHPGAVIGHWPQDLGYDPKMESFLRVGDRNTFREHVTIHRAAKAGNATVIGNDCYIMASAHVAHDAKIGNGVILVNYAGVTGHCEIHDGATMSGHTGIHQFCRIGKFAFMSALSTINKDLPPFFIFGGRPACAQGINVVKLRRAGIKPSVRKEIKRAYRAIYREGRTVKEAAEIIAKECPSDECKYLVDFILSSKRGIAAGAHEQFQTLKPHYNRGSARRGEGEPMEGAAEDDEDEVPLDEMM
jgi:UDP-N-acetylglucosamine acyltransferase